MSDEAERSVLVKLKTECGYQFTSKLESMFTDIKTSRDTMQEYKARRQAASAGEDDVELAVQVCVTCTVMNLGLMRTTLAVSQTAQKERQESGSNAVVPGDLGYPIFGIWAALFKGMRDISPVSHAY